MEGGIIAEEYVTSSVCHTSTTTNPLKFGHRRDEYFPFFFLVQMWLLTDAFPDKPRGWTHLVISWVTSEADLRQRFKCKELLWELHGTLTRMRKVIQGWEGSQPRMNWYTSYQGEQLELNLGETGKRKKAHASE